MLDIETLGRGPGCVVTSVAITPFHLKGAEVFPPDKAFRCKLSISDQLVAGFKIDPETHKWWMQQDAKVRENEFSGVFSIDKFCIDLEAYIHMIVKQFGDYRIWATAPKLDFGCMHSLFQHSGVEWPILYSTERCMRTLREMTKQLYPSFRLPKGSANHCAADDTDLQIRHIQACYKQLKQNSEIDTSEATRTSEAIHADVWPTVPVSASHSLTGGHRSTHKVISGGVGRVQGSSIRGGLSRSRRCSDGSSVCAVRGLYSSRAGRSPSAIVRRSTKK